MSEQDTREIKASAYRARVAAPLSCGPVRIKHGDPLPPQTLPLRPMATDSAVGPRRIASSRPAPAPRLSDPEYERRLEELAASLLAPAVSSDEQATPSPVDAKALAMPPTEMQARDAFPSSPEGATAPAVADEESPDAITEVPARRANTAAASPGEDRVEPSVQTAAPAAPRSRPAPGASRNKQRERTGAARRVAPTEPARGHQEPWLGPTPPAQAERVVQPTVKRSGRSQALAVLASVAIVLGLGATGAWWALHPDVADGLVAHAPGSDTASGASGTSGAGESSADAEPPPPPRPAQAEAKTREEEPVIVAPPPAAQSNDKAPEKAQDVPERADNSGTAGKQASSVTTPEAPQPRISAAPAPAEKNSRKEKDKAKKQDKAKQEKAKKLAKAEKKARRQERAQAAASLNRDDEIERLRGQAYSESSRDRSRRAAPRPPGEPVPPSSSNLTVTPVSSKGSEGKHSSISKELAQCQKLDGLFFQERCKWRICGEKWGQHGCPSYPRSELRF